MGQSCSPAGQRLKPGALGGPSPVAREARRGRAGVRQAGLPVVFPRFLLLQSRSEDPGKAAGLRGG